MFVISPETSLVSLDRLLAELTRRSVEGPPHTGARHSCAVGLPFHFFVRQRSKRAHVHAHRVANSPDRKHVVPDLPTDGRDGYAQHFGRFADRYENLSFAKILSQRLDDDPAACEPGRQCPS